jgi:hypothetical protein
MVMQQTFSAAGIPVVAAAPAAAALHFVFHCCKSDFVV